VVAIESMAQVVDELNVRRLTVDEYMQMAQAGIIDEDERVELLDGVIVRMSPINPPHAYVVSTIAHVFDRLVPEGAAVRTQCPVQLSRYSLPEPDIAIVQGPLRAYARRHPEPGEIFLIIEVADSSLRKDRMLKLPLYATAGIPETWIVDLVHKQFLVHRKPVAGSYTDITVHQAGEVIAPLAFPEARIEIASLFAELEP